MRPIHLTILLTLAVAPARGDAPRFRYVEKDWVGSGKNVEVWRVEHNLPGLQHLRILKRVHARSRLAPHERGPWGRRIVRISALLRADPRFVLRFGAGLIGETHTPE